MFFSEGITLSHMPSADVVQVNKTSFMACQAAYNSKLFDISYIWKLNGHTIDLTDTAHYVQVLLYLIQFWKHSLQCHTVVI